MLISLFIKYQEIFKEKNRLTSKNKIDIYNNIIRICKSLPFKYFRKNSILEYIIKESKIPKQYQKISSYILKRSGLIILIMTLYFK